MAANPMAAPTATMAVTTTTRPLGTNGLDESQVHTYGINWQADRVTFSVDGRDAGTVRMDTDDAANGGSNLVFSVMNRSEDTSITVYDLSYTPNGGDWW